MMVRILLVVLGAFHALNGLYMIASPEGWYAAVPGVTMTGPANVHFITDIGLAFLASGAGMVLGARARWAALALAGAVWPALHALFHVTLWLHHGFPSDARIAFSEIVLVLGVSALGLALGWMRAKQEGVV